MQLVELFDKQPINELNVIGSAIHKNYIPEKYKNLKLIGRGATSLVFDLDSDHVLMLTRDAIKADWLRRSDLGELIEVIDIYHPERDIRDKDVYALKVKRLEELSRENKSKVKKLIKFLTSEKMKAWRHKHEWKAQYAQKMSDMAHLEFNDIESLKEFFEFIIDYSDSQYEFDFLLRNFMQTRNGDIVATDPIVDKEILDVFQQAKQNKQNNRW